MIKGQLIKITYAIFGENTHFTYKMLQYTCFNYICYICSYDKCV